MLTRPKILSKFVKGLFSVDEVFQVFFDAFHDFRYYLCNTREHINAIPIVALKTGVLFVEILEDLGLSVFMDKWQKQLCRDNRSCKGQFRGETIKPSGFAPVDLVDDKDNFTFVWRSSPHSLVL